MFGVNEINNGGLEGQQWGKWQDRNGFTGGGKWHFSLLIFLDCFFTTFVFNYRVSVTSGSTRRYLDPTEVSSSSSPTPPVWHTKEWDSSSVWQRQRNPISLPLGKSCSLLCLCHCQKVCSVSQQSLKSMEESPGDKQLHFESWAQL